MRTTFNVLICLLFIFSNTFAAPGDPANGPTVYKVTPYNGTATFCSDCAAITIGMENTEFGVWYTLFHDGVEKFSMIGSNGPMIFPSVRSVGTYTVEAMSIHGVFATMDGSFTITEQVPTHVTSVNKSQVKIYPTLVKSSITIEVKNWKKITAIIYNTVGAQVEKYEIKAEKSVFDLSHLENGFYLVSVKNQTVKILVNH